MVRDENVCFSLPFCDYLMLVSERICLFSLACDGCELQTVTLIETGEHHLATYNLKFHDLPVRR